MQIGELLNFKLEMLATGIGLIAAIKFVVVPITKVLAPKIGGRATVITALVAGVVLSLTYRLIAAWPLTPRGWAEGILLGVIAGWAACGLQDAASALLRPYKFEDGAAPPAPADPPILR